MRKFILNHLLNTWCVWNRTLLYITNEQKYFSIARPQSCRKRQVFLNETWHKSSKLYLIIYLVATLTMKQLFFYNNIIIFTNLLFIIKQFIMSLSILWLPVWIFMLWGFLMILIMLLAYCPSRMSLVFWKTFTGQL